jgi:nitrogen fixation-related uncharacterized protein
MKIIIAIALTALCAAIFYWAVSSENTEKLKHEFQLEDRP